MTQQINPFGALASFLSDLPTTAPATPLPVLKPELTTPHAIKMEKRNEPITKLAGTIHYHQSNVTEQAQTIYLLIDDITPDGGEVDPMLAATYQALVKAGQLLFEAETHLYRYANRLENIRLMQVQLTADDEAVDAYHTRETE